ncbi:uncharacterized protein LOC122298958 [Carya illinoinensis]|uniref:uncharacterized protein LOC122298958 n=1 Tax=Carya illinoinensis TaxID=32201 RepID=UPI001C719676|nr:uncharacterized protein LOC122298958 [Carya illinoinensis]
MVGASCKRHDELQAAQATHIAHMIAIDELESRKGANQIGTIKRAGDSRWEDYYPLDFSENEKINLRFQLKHFEVNVFSNPMFQDLRSIADLCQRLVETEKSKTYYLIDRLDFHEQVKLAIYKSNAKYKVHKSNAKYKVQANKVQEYNKLKERKIGPCEVLQKINDNAYRVCLSSHLKTSDVFNMKHLSPYFVDPDKATED